MFVLEREVIWILWLNCICKRRS